MAADIDQQSGVVHDRALLFIEPHALGQPQCDQALPQHVLHRLPEAQVYAEREGGHEFGQPNVRAIDLAGIVSLPHSPTSYAERSAARLASSRDDFARSLVSIQALGGRRRRAGIGGVVRFAKRVCPKA